MQEIKLSYGIPNCLLKHITLLFLCSYSLAEELGTYQINRSDVVLASELILVGEPACGLRTNTPESVLREAYFARQRLWDCTDTANEILKLDLYNKIYDVDTEKGQHALNVVRDYKRECLIRFSDITDKEGGYLGNQKTTNHLEKMSSAKEVSKLKRSFGSLSRINGRNFCSATLVNIKDNEVGLLTAAHCISNAFLKDEKSDVFSMEYFHSELHFESISGDRITIRPSHDLTGMRFRFPQEDVVFLKLPLKSKNKYIELADFTPPLWTPLLIIGVSPYFGGKLDIDPNSLPTELADAMSVSFEPYCVLLARGDDGTLHHSCQTTKGLSGSGIAVLNKGIFYLSGIHSSGLLVNDEPNICSDQAVPTLNSGISLVSKQQVESR